jgi:hypothetical protein
MRLRRGTLAGERIGGHWYVSVAASVPLNSVDTVSPNIAEPVPLNLVGHAAIGWR